jgi:hypothetical protein
MSQDEAQARQVAVQALAARLARDPRLHAELLRARREFFGGTVAASADRRDAVAELRFAEWYALERESESLGVVPVTLAELAEAAGDLADSLAGVFLVTSASPVGVESVDLQDDEPLELAVPPGSLQAGDLVVGRLFPLAMDRWTPSTAAAVFRPGGQLAEAVRRDLGRLELGRRLWQVEIEHLLLRRTDQAPSPNAPPRAAAPKVVPGSAPLEHLEADLDRLFTAGGCTHSVSDVSDALAAAARPGPAMGQLLEELAFDTTVDLDRVREVLLQIWNAHHPEGFVDEPAEPPPARGDETLGEVLVRTLDEGLRQKRDVDDVFAQLERLAGLEPGAADDGGNPFDADGAATDGDGGEVEPGGDLGPLVQEYLWETGREQDPAVEALRIWARLQANAALPHTDLERVTGQDLMRLLLHVYLGAPADDRAAAVRQAFAELQAFYAWAARTQEFGLGSALHECRGALIEQVERLALAGRLLSAAADAEGRPGILLVEDVGPDGIGVVDDDGEHHWLAVGRDAAAQVRVGDLLLGALARSGRGRSLAGMVVVLPADARALME